MAYKDLQQFIDALDRAGELIRVKEYVNPHHEITEITDRLSKSDNNKALLFENTGYDFPLLINSMGSNKRMCMALGVDNLDAISKEIEQLFHQLSGPKEGILDKLKMLPMLGQISSWMPKQIGGRGACQQVVMEQPDLGKLPVMTCWPEDGGPFITLPIINTKHPTTGIRNVGMYRMQVFGPTLTGMHWHKHKVSAGHYNEYKKLGIKMPVAVALGGDPAYTYAATAPLPPNVDEYMLAGFLRKKKVELVKCITQDMYVPADADFIIEGYVDPEEELIWEGPFGDHTGYYSLADWYPKFHVTCITHKKNAVYPSTIVGIPPQEDAWIGKATERIFLAPIKMTLLPEIVDMELPIEGVFHNLTIVKIKKEYAGHAQKVMNAMWGAGQMMFNKILVITDGDLNIHNYTEVAKAISKNCDPQQDIYFSQGPMDVLDHSCSKFAFGGKMCIDATTKFEEEIRCTKQTDGAVFLDEEKVKNQFGEISSMNSSLLKLGISIVFIAVKKSRINHIKELHQNLFSLPDFAAVKIAIYVEHTINTNDIADCIWRFANNIDPKRDSFIIDGANESGISHIGFDGTRKTKELDNFHRDWPNILISDDATIKAIDEKWGNLSLGKFIQSPSLKYKQQVYKGGAVVSEK
ncbi:MAG: menaquinone biosynthesis decarboxylase [Bacteroidia bacterium]|nr:menaquinone biosynthesis decarboxylase [Bacteroidota bacterium]MBP6413609.1 menaquinone biosynthesis decarboxylase [Bacteroidia bacterium]